MRQKNFFDASKKPIPVKLINISAVFAHSGRSLGLDGGPKLWLLLDYSTTSSSWHFWARLDSQLVASLTHTHTHEEV